MNIRNITDEAWQNMAIAERNYLLSALRAQDDAEDATQECMMRRERERLAAQRRMAAEERAETQGYYFPDWH